MLNAQQRFEQDIPPSQRESVMEMLAEAAQGTDHEEVTLLSTDRYDSINVKAHGIVQVEDKEYTFIVEDGNWDGTTLLFWNDGTPFEPYVRTRWGLRPLPSIVSRALAEGKRKLLLATWNAVLDRPEVSRLPGNYTYDRRMQPGQSIEKYYKTEAAKYGLEIVPQEAAGETRVALEKGLAAAQEKGGRDDL